MSIFCNLAFQVTTASLGFVEQAAELGGACRLGVASGGGRGLQALEVRAGRPDLVRGDAEHDGARQRRHAEQRGAESLRPPVDGEQAKLERVAVAPRRDVGVILQLSFETHPLELSAPNAFEPRLLFEEAAFVRELPLAGRFDSARLIDEALLFGGDLGGDGRSTTLFGSTPLGFDLVAFVRKQGIE